MPSRINLMIEEKHFRKLERMYLSAPINGLYRPKISISEGKAEITMGAEEQFFHAADALHGSVYFKMLDDAAYFAANSVVTDVFLLTTGFNLHLIRQVTGGIISSVGKCTFSSSNLFIGEAKLYNQDGEEVAFGTGTFMKSRKALSKEIGYT